MKWCGSGLLSIFALCLLLVIEVDSGGNEKNHKLMSTLGLTKVQMYPSHYRKRLAVDERHTSRTDDSHMFIIKLPPNPHYYVQNYVHSNSALPKGSKIPVGFQSNGKPKKIYHWNIPVLKKMKMSSRLNLAANSRQHSANNIEKHSQSRIYHKLPSYYSPLKESFHKYFQGNGKPKSFYVIEKNKKTHSHKLLM